MPKEWISDDLVRFSVAKGTLVPVAEMGARSGKRSPPSYAVPANAPPKRQRRAHTTPTAGIAGVGLGVLPAVLPMAPARARSSSEESLASIATAPTSRRGSTTASPALAPSAPGVAPPPALLTPSIASLKPAALVVSSPTLSKQPSAGSAPPGDAAQLAVRLVAAHEHIASLLEGALRPLSPIRPTLSPSQAASLYEQLNKTRAMIEECVGLARAPPPPPSPSPPPPQSAGIAPMRVVSSLSVASDLSEVEQDAFASLVAVASAK
jgi:ribonuclease E